MCAIPSRALRRNESHTQWQTYPHEVVDYRQRKTPRRKDRRGVVLLLDGRKDAFFRQGDLDSRRCVIVTAPHTDGAKFALHVRGPMAERVCQESSHG
jgi:hypothetical protein